MVKSMVSPFFLTRGVYGCIMNVLYRHICLRLLKYKMYTVCRIMIIYASCKIHKLIVCNF